MVSGAMAVWCLPGGWRAAVLGHLCVCLGWWWLVAGVGAALQFWDVGPGGLVVTDAGTGPGGWPPLCGCRCRARGPGARGYLIFWLCGSDLQPLAARGTVGEGAVEMAVWGSGLSWTGASLHFSSSVLVELVTGVGALRPVESPELGPVCINYTTHCSGGDGFR